MWAPLNERLQGSDWGKAFLQYKTAWPSLSLPVTTHLEGEAKVPRQLQVPWVRTEMMGVEIFFEALMISRMRGTPRVTFMAATPAK
jgi:hypothetical protein